MAVSAESLEQELTISSSPSNIIRIEPFVYELRSKWEIDEEIYGNLLVCLTEAVNNAIVHGNKADNRKQVRVCLKRDGHKLICFVRDEGPGFDFNHLPDPTAPENIENLGGRGIFLMKALSDLVVFSNDGSSVEIQFRI